VIPVGFNPACLWIVRSELLLLQESHCGPDARTSPGDVGSSIKIFGHFLDLAVGSLGKGKFGTSDV
jgi:hypothetical protein